MEPPPPRSSAVKETVADTSVTETTQPAQSEAEAEGPVQLQQETPPVSQVEQAADGSESGTQSVDVDTIQPAAEETAAPPPRRKRVFPWAAVNRPQEEEEEEEAAPAPAKRARPPPKPRGRKKNTATTETEVAGEQGEAEEGESQPVRKRPSAKARGKRRADAADGEDGAEAPAPAKRTRRPRKLRGQGGTGSAGEEGAEVGEGEAVEQAEGGEPAVRRKPRQPRTKKKSPAEGEGEGDQDAPQPKKKGRPPREPTPEDAEDHEIDPENTFMDSIASRNIRVGKLSVREKAMREIDWVAVRQRQREEDARPISTKEAREAAEKLLIEEAPQADGPRFQMVDGQIQFVHGSTMVDREAEADREIENYEVVEERDLTTRITSRSFLKNNKRFPNDFILPGQGRRWTRDDTDLFYQGLSHFGTDFQMISHMFPGSTRRSIKLKFTREERDDPERVRKHLLGSSTIVSHWDNFMQVSNMEEQQFADADAIKRQMADHEAEMREKINAAKAETEERKRQQREAGLLDDDADGDPNNKENGKTKKKRKGKEKQVTFQEEAGVEILGTVDDDDTWGQE
jgi:transcription factor TFIIIB component B''